MRITIQEFHVRRDAGRADKQTKSCPVLLGLEMKARSESVVYYFKCREDSAFWEIRAYLIEQEGLTRTVAYFSLILCTVQNCC